MNDGRELITVRGVRVVQFAEQNRVRWVSGAAVDADGSNGQSYDPITKERLWAYKPDDTGLDLLANAGYPHGYYWNVLVCTRPGVGKKPKPIQVGDGWLSSTAYEWSGKPRLDPQRYVDACSVPYVVVNPHVRKLARGVVLGCKAVVTYLGLSAEAVVADVSGPDDIGEISIALADQLGADSNPRTGGVNKGVTFELFPGTPGNIRGVQYALLRA